MAEPMNSAERIRAYLTARAAHRKHEQSQGWATPGAVVDEEFDYATGKYVQLTEADLEAVLQTLEILANVAGLSTEKVEILETFDAIEQRERVHPAGPADRPVTD